VYALGQGNGDPYPSGTKYRIGEAGVWTARYYNAGPPWAQAGSAQMQAWLRDVVDEQASGYNADKWLVERARGYPLFKAWKMQQTLAPYLPTAQETAEAFAAEVQKIAPLPGPVYAQPIYMPGPTPQQYAPAPPVLYPTQPAEAPAPEEKKAPGWGAALLLAIPVVLSQM
jgi:hypothetical protein